MSSSSAPWLNIDMNIWTITVPHSDTYGDQWWRHFVPCPGIITQNCWRQRPWSLFYYPRFRYHHQLNKEKQHNYLCWTHFVFVIFRFKKNDSIVWVLWMHLQYVAKRRRYRQLILKYYISRLIITFFNYNYMELLSFIN